MECYYCGDITKELKVNTCCYRTVCRNCLPTLTHICLCNKKVHIEEFGTVEPNIPELGAFLLEEALKADVWYKSVENAIWKLPVPKNEYLKANCKELKIYAEDLEKISSFSRNKYYIQDIKKYSWNQPGILNCGIVYSSEEFYRLERESLNAVKLNALDLGNVPIQTPEICLAAVTRDGYALKYVKQQTPEICLAAAARYGYALQYVNEQTPELCLAAVTRYGHALQYVKEQTPEICLAAVTENGGSLEYVKEQTPEICLAAVTQYGYALIYVHIQTPEICIAAVTQDGLALQYVKEQTAEICLAAVNQNGYALQYVKKQTPEICFSSCN